MASTMCTFRLEKSTLNDLVFLSKTLGFSKTESLSRAIRMYRSALETKISNVNTSIAVNTPISSPVVVEKNNIFERVMPLNDKDFLSCRFLQATGVIVNEETGNRYGPYLIGDIKFLPKELALLLKESGKVVFD